MFITPAAPPDKAPERRPVCPLTLPRELASPDREPVTTSELIAGQPLCITTAEKGGNPPFSTQTVGATSPLAPMAAQGLPALTGTGRSTRPTVIATALIVRRRPLAGGSARPVLELRLALDRRVGTARKQPEEGRNTGPLDQIGGRPATTVTTSNPLGRGSTAAAVSPALPTTVPHGSQLTLVSIMELVHIKDIIAVDGQIVRLVGSLGAAINTSVLVALGGAGRKAKLDCGASDVAEIGANEPELPCHFKNGA